MNATTHAKTLLMQCEPAMIARLSHAQACRLRAQLAHAYHRLERKHAASPVLSHDLSEAYNRVGADLAALDLAAAERRSGRVGADWQ